MIRFIKNLPIREKLILVIMLASLSVLALLSISALIYDRYALHQRLVQEFDVISKIIGDRSTAALVFNDPTLAEENLAALRARSIVVTACIYTATGPLFAKYQRDSQTTSCPSLFEQDGYRFTEDYFDFSQPILLEGEQIGSIAMRSELADLEARHANYAFTIGIVVLVAIFVAWILSLRLQRLISRPIYQLVTTASTVTRRGDYSLRAEKESDDELGLLVETFNRMLATIEIQNRALMDAKEHLEELVATRTEALEQANRNLQRSEQQLRVIIVSLAEGLVVTDGQQRIVLINPEGENILGYKEIELKGKSFHDIVHVHTDHQKCSLFESMTDGAYLQSDNEYFKHKDGSFFPVAVVTAPLVEQGDITGCVMAFQDITERKHAEAEIKRLNETLEQRVIDRTRELHQTNRQLQVTLTELRATQTRIIQTEKLSALGTMVAGIAHELNNPLMGILNYVQYAEEEIDNPKIKKLLHKAERELNRMANIVKNMLSFARSSPDKLTQVGVRQALENTLQLLVADFRYRKIELIDELPDTLPPVWAKLDGLQQVFLNLLLNARDAMADSEQKRIIVRGCVQDQMVKITVEDSGPGVPENIQSRIFDPFFTTKPVGSGTGLGLSVSRNIIMGFRGAISCENSEAGGARFILSLRTGPAVI